MEVPFSIGIKNCEMMAFVEDALLLLMLNVSLCDKYELNPDDIAPSQQVSHSDTKLSLFTKPS